MRDKIILLVEDNPDDVELTIRAFRKNHLGNHLVVVNDGEEALDYLFAAGKHAGRDPRRLPALVLLDLKLPKIDGIEVLKRIRHDERTKLIPVVILTCSAEEQDLVQSYNNGANSYIRKPVDFDEFMEATKQIGLYWLLINNPPPDSGS